MTRDRRTSDPRAADLLARFAAAFDVPQHPVPVDSVACDLLGLMITETDDIEVSGLLVPETMRVYVNAREASENEGRRRFTIAHEIGHWVCQCDEGRITPPHPILCRDADMTDEVDKEMEREANNFAASLLMPEAQVHSVAATGASITAAAAEFGVSDVAMRWRYFNLGIAMPEDDDAGGV